MPVTTFPSAIRPSAIPDQNHFLAKATIDASRKFNLGGTRTTLNINAKDMVALANRFELSRRASEKLQREENLLECVTTGIDDESTTKSIRSYLKKVKVPDEISTSSRFFLVTARQRTPGKVTSREYARLPRRALEGLGDVLRVEHEIANSMNFLLGFAEDAARNILFLVIPEGKLGTYIVKPGMWMGMVPPQEEDPPPPEVKPYPDDPLQDFAGCYSQCVKEVPDWMLALVSGICGGCIAAIGVATGTAGVPGAPAITLPALIAICSGCAVAVGAVLGNCLLTCHEML